VADLEGLIRILADGGFDGPVCVELASLGSVDVDELAMIEHSVCLVAEASAGERPLTRRSKAFGRSSENARAPLGGAERRPG
jgi:hypothetical protein